MRHEQPGPEAPDEPIEPDVQPEGVTRGGITVPDANDSGITTPPISGWGEALQTGGSEGGENADE